MNTIEKYFGVSNQIFPEIQEAVPFDIYLKLGPNKYTKVFSRGIEIEHERVKNYIEKGTDQFFILKQDRRNFLLQTQKVLGRLYKQDRLSDPEALHILTDLAAQTLSEIFSNHEFDYTCYELSTTLISGYLEASKNHPAVLPHLLKMAKTQKHLYHHSIMTSIFSCLVARQLEPDNKTFHMNSGLAGFLHDIGMCKLSVEVDEHGLELTEEAKRQLHTHPLLGSYMVAQIKDVPIEVTAAIADHHENMNGTGYPHEKPGNKISKIGRLISLTEEFSALVGGSKENTPLNPQMALHALRSSDRLDQKYVDALAKLLKL